MCLSTTLKNYALREKLYKIESHTDQSAMVLAGKIIDSGSKALILGSAVVTSYQPSMAESESLLVHVREVVTADRLSDYDISNYISL